MSIVESTTYEAPGQPGSPVELQDRYENFIGGEWIPPTTGEYRENVTPSTGEPFCEVAESGAQDIELALDAAHAAKDEWGRRSPAERAAVLNAVAEDSHHVPVIGDVGGIAKTTMSGNDHGPAFEPEFGA